MVILPAKGCESKDKTLHSTTKGSSTTIAAIQVRSSSCRGAPSGHWDSPSEERTWGQKVGEILQRRGTGDWHWSWQDSSRGVGSISNWDATNKRGPGCRRWM